MDMPEIVRDKRTYEQLLMHKYLHFGIMDFDMKI